MYKILTIVLIHYTLLEQKTVKHNHKKQINEKHLETAFGYKNFVSNKTQCYSDVFKKRRYEIQDWEDFQSCRKFIAKELAVHLIIDIKTVKATELRAKLGFNQIDPIMSKQESMGLKIKKIFSGRRNN